MRDKTLSLEIEDEYAQETCQVRECGEIKLLRRLLERAILDLGKIRIDQHVVRECRSWFYSSSIQPFSYLWICDSLNVCPIQLKQRLKIQKKLR